MDGLTDFITKYRWEDIFTVWYVLVDDAHQVLQRQFGEWRRRGPKPVFSDSEVITVALIADTYFAGDEDKALSFVRQYHIQMFPLLPAPGQFNYRRRALCLIIEQVRRLIISQWDLLQTREGDTDTLRLTDSAPIPVCTYTRARQNKTMLQAMGQDRSLYFGVMPSRKAGLFGFRLHVSASFEQVIDSWLLAPASIHDGQVTGLYETQESGALAELLMLGDGAFNNPGWLASLRYKHGANLQIWALPRRDTRKPWPAQFRAVVAKVRRRVESAFSVLCTSVLCTVFNIEQPRARSLQGLVCRVATRLLAYTLCFITGPLLAFCGFQTQN